MGHVVQGLTGDTATALFIATIGRSLRLGRCPVVDRNMLLGVSKINHVRVVGVGTIRSTVSMLVPCMVLRMMSHSSVQRHVVCTLLGQYGTVRADGSVIELPRVAEHQPWLK